MLNKYLLIIAGSGRVLAQKARKAGFRPLVIDLFADLDTLEIAEQVMRVSSLTIENLAPAIDGLSKLYPVNDVIYGSGFEKHHQSLFFLEERFNLLGNSADVFVRIQDKKTLFNYLAEQNIVFPEVVFSRPNSEAWLIKPFQSEGGCGISFDKGNGVFAKGRYWQKFQQGETMSVSFLADGEKAWILGFNRQWSTDLDSEQPFVFSGVYTLAKILKKIQRIISEWLSKLVPYFGLRGLNGIDFIWYQEQCYFLEINPRPTASIAFYPAKLIDCLVENKPQNMQDFDRKDCQGYQIIYAKQQLRIPEAFIWPEWSQDRPGKNTLISKYQPVCSIIACENSPERVLSKLAARQQIIENTLQKEI